MIAPQPPSESTDRPSDVSRKLGFASATTKPSYQRIAWRSSRSSTTAVATGIPPSETSPVPGLATHRIRSTVRCQGRPRHRPPRACSGSHTPGLRHNGAVAAAPGDHRHVRLRAHGQGRSTASATSASAAAPGRPTDIPEADYAAIRSARPPLPHRSAGSCGLAFGALVLLFVILTRPVLLLAGAPAGMLGWFGFLRPIVRRRHWRDVQALTRTLAAPPRAAARVASSVTDHEPSARRSTRGVLRAVMASYPTGVTIVTSQFEGNLVGMAANSFTSVSLDPPIVLVCCQRARAHGRGREALGPLRDPHPAPRPGRRSARVRRPRRAALRRRRPRARRATACRSSTTGSRCSSASLQHVVAGDHEVLFGEVERCERREGVPLMFHESALRMLPKLPPLTATGVGGAVGRGRRPLRLAGARARAAAAAGLTAERPTPRAPAAAARRTRRRRRAASGRAPSAPPATGTSSDVPTSAALRWLSELPSACRSRPPAVSAPCGARRLEPAQQVVGDGRVVALVDDHAGGRVRDVEEHRALVDPEPRHGRRDVVGDVHEHAAPAGLDPDALHHALRRSRGAARWAAMASASEGTICSTSCVVSSPPASSTRARSRPARGRRRAPARAA